MQRAGGRRAVQEDLSKLHSASVGTEGSPDPHAQQVLGACLAGGLGLGPGAAQSEDEADPARALGVGLVVSFPCTQPFLRRRRWRSVLTVSETDIY